MAEMGLGYGSEYQLLRFLGHHRNELNKIIKVNTKFKGELIWLDYPKNFKKMSLDGEYTGVNFLDDEIIKESFSPEKIKSLKHGWREFWSIKGSQPNIDGLILHKLENEVELIIVEAKANLKEIESKTESETNNKIQEAFKDTQRNLNICNNNWFGKYYQLANRLALVNFLNRDIKSSLLYIYFLNGYEKRKLTGRNIEFIESKSVERISDWEKAIKEQYEELGINEISNQIIEKVFVDCGK